MQPTPQTIADFYEENNTKVSVHKNSGTVVSMNTVSGVDLWKFRNGEWILMQTIKSGYGGGKKPKTSKTPKPKDKPKPKAKPKKASYDAVRYNDNGLDTRID